MFESRELKALEQRRQALLLKCEAQRQLLRLDLAQLRLSAGWFDAGAGWLRQARPFLMVLAPLAGFWAVRKATRRPAGGAVGIWERVAGGLALYQRVRGLWDQFAQRPPK